MSTATATSPTEDLLCSFCNIVSEDLQLLARLHDRELDEEIISTLKAIRFPEQLGLLLTSEKAKPVLQLLQQTVESWPAKLPEKEKDFLDMDFAGIYLNHACRASPQESVWVDEENLAMQAPMFQVREIYKRHGLVVKNWRIQPDDHLVNQLQFIAYILGTEASTDSLREIARFLDEHLLRWVIQFAERAAANCETAFYASLVLLTALYLDELRDLLARILDESRPTTEEIEQRMKPKNEAVVIPMQYIPGTAESW